MKKLLFLFAMLAGATFCAAQIVPAPTENQTQAIDKIMAPIRNKVTGILEADKTGQYAAYKTDMDRVILEKDQARKWELIDKLERDHAVFMRNAFTSARVNLDDLRKQVAGILGHNKFEMDAFGGISSESFLPAATIPLRFDAELHCPFEVVDEYTSQTLSTDCNGSASSCSITTGALAVFDGGCRGQGLTGDKFELPAGTFNKITVSAQFDAYAWGFTFAIGGFGKVESKIGVQLRGPGVEKLIIVKDVWCIAPVIWFKRYELNLYNFQAQAEFNGNFAGENSYTAQVFNESFAITVPFLNGGTCYCISSGFDFIKIAATN